MANLIAVTTRSAEDAAQWLEPMLPGLPVRTVATGRLCAHFVALPPAARGALEGALHDAQRARQIVVGHAQLVAQLGARGGAIPFRLPSLFDGEHALIDLLARHEAPLLACLHRVSGCAEWAVRVRLSDQAAAAEPPAVPAGGAAYLRARLQRRAERRDMTAARAHVLAGVLQTLAAHAREVDVAPCGRDDPTVDPCVWRGSLLIDERSTSSFIDALAVAAHELGSVGLGFASNGPFPPYSFVREALGTNAQPT